MRQLYCRECMEIIGSWTDTQWQCSKHGLLHDDDVVTDMPTRDFHCKKSWPTAIGTLRPFGCDSKQCASCAKSEWADGVAGCTVCGRPGSEIVECTDSRCMMLSDLKDEARSLLQSLCK